MKSNTLTGEQVKYQIQRKNKVNRIQSYLNWFFKYNLAILLFFRLSLNTCPLSKGSPSLFTCFFGSYTTSSKPYSLKWEPFFFSFIYFCISFLWPQEHRAVELDRAFEIQLSSFAESFSCFHWVTSNIKEISCLQDSPGHSLTYWHC